MDSFVGLLGFCQPFGPYRLGGAHARVAGQDNGKVWIGANCIIVFDKNDFINLQP
jgi:Zn-finger protein